MVNELFGIPVYSTKLEQHEKYKQDFSSYITDDKFFTVNENWSSKTQTTLNNSYNNELPWSDLVSEIHKHLNEYIKIFQPKVNYTIETTGWMNRYFKGDYQEQHNHVNENNIFSCAYMLDVPENSGNFVFVNTALDFYSYTGFDNMFNVSPVRSFIPPLNEGDLIIFPSYVEHFVSKNLSDKTRATVSMNFTIKENNNGI